MRRLLCTLALALGMTAGACAAPIDLSVDTLDGKTFTLADQRGQWVVVNFWATWCGPCLKEMPELDELDRSREDVVVLGLAFEDTTPEDLIKFLEKRPVGYAIAPVDVYAPPAAFSVPKGLPTTHLIAPDGSLHESFIGPVTAADLERAMLAPKAD